MLNTNIEIYRAVIKLLQKNYSDATSWPGRRPWPWPRSSYFYKTTLYSTHAAAALLLSRGQISAILSCGVHLAQMQQSHKCVMVMAAD